MKAIQDSKFQIPDSNQTANTSTPSSSTGRDLTSPAWSPFHFPAILVDASGNIILCPGCRGSSITKQQRAESAEHRVKPSAPCSMPYAALFVCNEFQKNKEAP